jgi:hypothetical protein
MNWGWKMAIVYTAFVVAIMTFVFKARSEKIDLVAADYYAQELNFKDRMEASSNANEFFSSISVMNGDGVITIQLPQEQAKRIYDAHVHFYCPSDADKDVEMDLQVNENAQAIVPTTSVKEGNYLAKLSWTADDKSHYIEKKLSVK